MQTLVLGGTENKTHTHTHRNTLITHILFLVCSRLEQVAVNGSHYTSNTPIITPVLIHTSGGLVVLVGVGSKALKKPNTLPPTPAHTHTHTAGRSGKTKATTGVLTLPEANSAAFISPLLLL